MAVATVLIADDQKDLRVVMRTMLERASDDWKVLETADGEQALAAAQSHSPDLLILDQRMPGLTGTQVAETLREDGYRGPIILFSAYLDDDVETRAAALDLRTLPKSDIGRLVAVSVAALGPAS